MADKSNSPLSDEDGKSKEAIKRRQKKLGFLGGLDAASGSALAVGLGKLGQPLSGNTEVHALDTSGEGQRGDSTRFFKGK